MKPGYQTSEFWLHLLAGLAISLVTLFNPVAAGLPSWAQAIHGVIAPVLLAWLSKIYSDGRTELKTALVAGAVAASAVDSQAAAVSVLKNQ